LTIWTINTITEGLVTVSVLRAHTLTSETHKSHTYTHICIRELTQKHVSKLKHVYMHGQTTHTQRGFVLHCRAKPVRAEQPREPLGTKLINIQIHICRIKPQPCLSKLSGNLMNLHCTVSLCCAQLITFPVAHTVFKRFTHKRTLTQTQNGH